MIRCIVCHRSSLVRYSYLFVKDLMLGEVVIMNALSHCLQSAKDCHENTNSSLNDLINFDIRNGLASSGSCLCKD